MRDVARIRPFMEEVTKLWEENPDLRFAQLFNYVYWNAKYDPFYYEEEDTLKLIEELRK